MFTDYRLKVCYLTKPSTVKQDSPNAFSVNLYNSITIVYYKNNLDIDSIWTYLNLSIYLPKLFIMMAYSAGAAEYTDCITVEKFICLCLPTNRTWLKFNDPKVNYSGDLGVGKVCHNLRLEPCWSMLVIGTLSAMWVRLGPLSRSGHVCLIIA